MTLLQKLVALAIPLLISSKSCYKSSDSFNANSSFFDSFQFVTENDPTRGYVDYIDQSTAWDLGLIKYVDNKVYIGADFTNIVDDYSRGRKSIRLSSNRVLNGKQLLVIDLEHMPSTVGKKAPAGCSTWPAFWTFGPNWPYSGEIDIIEYVNTDSTIQTTLHTGSGCDQGSEDPASFSGKWANSYTGMPSDDCNVAAADQYGNAGCGIIGQPDTVGAAFNNRKSGGVYVMEWDSNSQIRTFFFSRENIPADLQSRNPNPDSWGLPYARFQVGNNDCSADHFQNHNIVFDLTFCGEWAGAVFGNSCSSSGTSCESFVKYNPEEFAEAYWLINHVDVYDSC